MFGGRKEISLFLFHPSESLLTGSKIKELDHISTLICMTESYATSSFYNNSTYNSVSGAIKHLFLRNKGILINTISLGSVISFISVSS